MFTSSYHPSAQMITLFSSETRSTNFSFYFKRIYLRKVCTNKKVFQSKVNRALSSQYERGRGGVRSKLSKFEHVQGFMYGEVPMWVGGPRLGSGVP